MENETDQTWPRRVDYLRADTNLLRARRFLKARGKNRPLQYFEGNWWVGNDPIHVSELRQEIRRTDPTFTFDSRGVSGMLRELRDLCAPPLAPAKVEPKAAAGNLDYDGY